MQEQSKSVYKTLTWLLLLVVIGLYALHHWYSGTLKEHLAAHQAKIAEGAQQLKEAKTSLDLAAQNEKGLRGEIDRLKTSHHSEVQGLTGQIEAATQANLALKGDMETLKTRDAEALAAAQRQATDAYAELQGRFDAATRQIAALGADIEGLKQAQADASARHETQLTAAEQQHQARLRELEGQLNERIAALRTALEGSDPERATLFAGFDERIQKAQATIAALEATETDLTGQLTAAKQAIEEKTQALTESGKRLETTQSELMQTRGELAELMARHDAAMDKATMDRAALQAKHDAAVAKAAQDQAALEAQHAAALDQAAKQRADLEAQHAAALDQAAKQQADLKAQHAAALDQAAKDQAGLQAKHEAALAAAAKERTDLQARHEAEQAQTKAAHADQMGEAQNRIATLTASLAAEQAALAALQAKHDQMVAELRGNLADTEKSLAGVKSDLNTATEAAAKQKAALEQQIAEAKGHVAKLEETLATERKQYEAARLAAQQAHTTAMTDQRSLWVRVSELGGRETEQGMLLSLAETDLKFPISKATLPPGELPSLDRIAALLVQFPRLTARIEGHTDAAGRDETNLALSQARADAVKQALVDRGVAPERLEAAGLGETRPIADNATKAGSRKNRRVEVYIVEGAQ